MKYALLHHLAAYTACKLLLAAVLGGIVGLERELRGKPAGLRTNVLIATGAALFTVISTQMGAQSDPSRIAAQVVTGVGFIGAGVILRERGTVVGLTTAATVFVVAAVGVGVGAGLLWPSVAATAVLLVALLLLVPFEKWIHRRFPQARAAQSDAPPSDQVR